MVTEGLKVVPERDARAVVAAIPPGGRRGGGRAWSAPARLVLAWLAGVGPALAEPPQHPARFAVRYGVSFLGLPVGEADLALAWGEGRYALDLSGRLRGMPGFFLDGAGGAAAAGRVVPADPARLEPASFQVESRYAGRPVRVTMRLERGRGRGRGRGQGRDHDGSRVRDVVLDPVPTPRPDRVPLGPEDTVGVLDPLSILAVPVGSAPLDPGLCERRIPVFDGATRADLVLSRGALVAVEKGPYRGPALECRVRWVPVAGHRANGSGVRRMAENDDMRVRLAPVPGMTMGTATGAVLLPLAISVGTGWGTVRVEATGWGEGAAPPAVPPSAPPSAEGAADGSAGGRPGVRVSLPRAR